VYAVGVHPRHGHVWRTVGHQGGQVARAREPKQLQEVIGESGTSHRISLDELSTSRAVVLTRMIAVS
jgi:hypothetical protein